MHAIARHSPKQGTEHHQPRQQTAQPDQQLAATGPQGFQQGNAVLLSAGEEPQGNGHGQNAQQYPNERGQPKELLGPSDGAGHRCVGVARAAPALALLQLRLQPAGVSVEDVIFALKQIAVTAAAAFHKNAGGGHILQVHQRPGGQQKGREALIRLADQLTGHGQPQVAQLHRFSRCHL